MWPRCQLQEYQEGTINRARPGKNNKNSNIGTLSYQAGAQSVAMHVEGVWLQQCCMLCVPKLLTKGGLFNVIINCYSYEKQSKLP